MKKPIFVLSADWHLQSSNIDLIKSLASQKCALAKSLGLSEVIVLGDIINSRIAQRLDVLTGFLEILDIFEENNIRLIAISGNHDRYNYLEINSFLDPFQHHPNFLLTRDSSTLFQAPVALTFLSFFKEEKWLEIYKSLSINEGFKNILCTHIGFQGSLNNDGSKHESIIKPELFKDWDLVLSGHIHNQCKVAKNIFHIPSICQNNFGEDLEKGFTVLYDDLSFELVKSDFPKYLTVQVDLDKQTKKQYDPILNASIEHAKTSKDRFRFEFTGEANKLKTIDKGQYEKLGIDVSIKNKEVEIKEVEKYQQVKVLSNSEIKESFKEFCVQEELDYETGIKYLNQKL